MDNQPFCQKLSALRRSRGITQRQAAADLQISQALLSHYETGAREPGLPFICRACDYYGVSADELLGRESASIASLKPVLREMAGALRDIADRMEAYTE